MIAGLSSSGIAGAIRTAGQARATMDTMTRQIATGQRVASVRDDGAAWTRANQLRGTAQARERLVEQVALTRAAVSWARATGEERQIYAGQARELALAATVPGLSAETAASLQADYLQTRTLFNRNTYGAIPSDLLIGRADGTGTWAPFSNSSSSASQVAWLDTPDGATGLWGATNPIPVTNDAATASITTTASAASVRTIWDTTGDAVRDISASLGGLEVRLERHIRHQNASSEREAAQAASLTDADLAKASAARALALTRQQLALSTVQQAINAYGNFAGGLLGNVLRTQRGILA